MRWSRTLTLLLFALLALCFGLAAGLDPWFESWAGNRADSADILNVMLGSSRRMFANHFFIKADEYYHSGAYPSIFDNRAAFEAQHMAADAGAVEDKNKGDETGFLGKPRDWIDAFSRHFFPTAHTHLDEGAPGDELGGSAKVREILPWLRLSVELDPSRVQTYVTTAFWLRKRLGKPAEAEQFLRQGLRANPGSYEILFELGLIYNEDHHDVERARNLWKAALSNWRQTEKSKPEPDKWMLDMIAQQLAKLEDKAGNYAQEASYLEISKTVSPDPKVVEERIKEARLKAGLPPAEPASSPSRVPDPKP